MFLQLTIRAEPGVLRGMGWIGPDPDRLMTEAAANLHGRSIHTANVKLRTNQGRVSPTVAPPQIAVYQTIASAR